MNGDGCDTCPYHDFQGALLAIENCIQFVDDDYAAYKAFYNGVCAVIEELDL